MSLDKINDTEWEISYCGDDGGSISFGLTATSKGLETHSDYISWADIYTARNAVVPKVDLATEPLRELFEAQLRTYDPRLLFIDRYTNGEYKNTGFESAWQGFKLAYGCLDGLLQLKLDLSPNFFENPNV